METERHVEIDETHEEPQEAENAATVEVAASAVALAETTAAAAELDAAERMRRLEESNEAWRNQLAEGVNSLSSNLRLLQEDALPSLQTENAALAASLSSLAERQEALELQYLQSIPPQSTPTPTESEPLADGAATIAAGPLEVEAGTSLDGEHREQTTSPGARTSRRRRWI